MKNKEFPIVNTKIPGLSKTFLLPADRREYFLAKAGDEIRKLKEYLSQNTFMAFLLGPKNSGKGTYTKLFMEMVGSENVAHLSVGDVVRDVHYRELADEDKKRNFVEFLGRRYRGYMSIADILASIEGRSQSSLLPTEVVIALIEREIDRLGKKAIFIDGFPRNLDQVSYAIYFRSLMGYRDDPDFFVFIDVPMSIIDARIKSRVICPKCKSPRSMKVLRTKDIGYDEKTGEFYLICDNSTCEPTRLVVKEGDELGIAPIRDRIELDYKVMEQLMELQGVPKIYLRNSIPVALARENVDDYEITPSYRYERDGNAVKIIEEQWVVEDDAGVGSYSLLPEAVAVGLIKSVARVLGL
ncbi:MAG: nucleoside monophosphate kinase [Candidatus Sungbacteria bacterium]|nr:nucleoside monophosphate kinase [Candidatus Sungbacteria bacterium]